ncbi:MAG TPA: hypothetical protein VMA36_10835 [Candidatus Limnocylindria bacterium]|jgi:hypothetical protein|nr:hypothetical protein [Candidatus Limnocylindria bacterium]
MTLPLPLLLAALGVVLVTVAIFAPQRVRAAPPAVSLAPPLAPPAQAWSPPQSDAYVVESIAEPEPVTTSSWTALIDPLAAGCTPQGRVALVDALATVATPWAHDVLLRAQADEPDPMVRAALDAALRDVRFTSSES